MVILRAGLWARDLGEGGVAKTVQKKKDKSR